MAMGEQTEEHALEILPDQGHVDGEQVGKRQLCLHTSPEVAGTLSGRAVDTGQEGALWEGPGVYFSELKRGSCRRVPDHQLLCRHEGTSKTWPIPPGTVLTPQPPGLRRELGSGLYGKGRSSAVHEPARLLVSLKGISLHPSTLRAKDLGLLLTQ